MKNNTKQVIIIRKDLKMRRGKEISQGCHASMKAILDRGDYVDDKLVINMTPEMQDWMMGIFTKICVRVDSEDELLNIYEQAKIKGMVCSLILDAGLTEFGGIKTYTAVAIGPGNIEDINEITGHLKLL